MDKKTLIGLSLAAAALVGGAVYFQRDAQTTESALAGKDALAPVLEKRVNDVAAVRVVRNSGSYTLKKVGDGWGLAEKGDHPVETSTVRKALLVLRDMKRLEKKTADPAKHAQLDLADPKADGSKCVQIDLLDAGGATLASVLVGKQLDQKNALSSNRTYARLAGEDQCWLVAGKAEFFESPVDWLEKKIVEVKRDRVQKVEILHPDGERYDISRPDKATSDFALAEIPEGKEPSYAGAAGAVASALEWVNLEDVAPIASIDFSDGAGPVATFTTFDGVVVQVTTKDQDGKSWARFEARYEAPAATAQGPAPAPAEGQPAPEDPAKAAEAARAEVEKLQKKLSGWAYQISSYSRSNFGKKKSDVLKDKAQAAGSGEHGDEVAPLDAGAGGEGQPMIIPDSLPKEIQDQIKAHQESLGNEVQIGGGKPAEGALPEGSHVHADGTVHQGSHDGHDHATPEGGSTPPADDAGADPRR
jgi:hypothetical protein